MSKESISWFQWNIQIYSKGKYLKSLFKQGQGPGEIYAKYIPGIYNKAENYVLVKTIMHPTINTL